MYIDNHARGEQNKRKAGLAISEGVRNLTCKAGVEESRKLRRPNFVRSSRACPDWSPPGSADFPESPRFGLSHHHEFRAVAVARLFRTAAALCGYISISAFHLEIQLLTQDSVAGSVDLSRQSLPHTRLLTPRS